MEEGPSADPLDISTDPQLIKEAQAEMSKVDVLVCGRCHEVFHLVEEFQSHKSNEKEGKCSGTSSLKCETEEKPQIWGYNLWRVKKLQTIKEKNEPTPSTWDIYKIWSTLEATEKDLWIAAGRRLQLCDSIARFDMTEAKVTEKDPLAIDAGEEPEAKTRSGGKKRGVRSVQDPEEYNVEKILNKRYNPKKRTHEYQVKWENYEELTWEPVSNLENCRVLMQEYEDKVNKEKAATPKTTAAQPKKKAPKVSVATTPGVSSTPVKIFPKPTLGSPIVVLTPDGGRPQRSSKQKALNQVKEWCGGLSDDESRKSDNFDPTKSLKRRATDTTDDSEDDEEVKKPPMKRVAKIITYSNNGLGGGATRCGTTTKLPDNVLIPDSKGVVRISSKQLPSLSSGVYIMSKSSGIIKLDSAASKIATSGGQAIVKVSPKIGQTQVRIIKKESNSTPLKKPTITTVPPTKLTTPTGAKLGTLKTPKVAKATPPKTSTPLTGTKKVVVVKKDSMTTPTKKKQAVAKGGAAGKTTPLAPSTGASAGAVASKTELQDLMSTLMDDESDDGLEELEFPTDIEIPAPDSPPGDFTLDPFTGRIAGQEYEEPSSFVDDMTVEETTNGDEDAEVKPPPDREVVEEEEVDGDKEEVIKKEKENQSPSTSDNIDNIVKLAAADITEDDLKQPADESPKSDTQVSSPPPVALATTPSSKSDSSVKASSPTKTVVTTKVIKHRVQMNNRPGMQKSNSNDSILNKALANSNIIQKKSPFGARQQQQQQQKFTRVVTTPRPQHTIIQQQQKTPQQLVQRVVTPVVRRVVPRLGGVASPTKTHTGISPPIKVGAQHHHPQSRFHTGSSPQVTPRNVYTKTVVQKRVGSTTISRASPKQQVTPPRHQQQVARQHQQRTAGTNQVISMPSLEEETPAAVTNKKGGASSSPDKNVQSLFQLDGGEKPVYLTGDDGTVYQVAGQNEEGQTILITQDSNGQQQCLLVTSESMAEEGGQQQIPQEAEPMQEGGEDEVTNEGGAAGGEEQPMVAQLIRAEPPSPGGTHKVLVMLPSGEMMETQVSAEEYASLELET